MMTAQQSLLPDDNGAAVADETGVQSSFLRALTTAGHMRAIEWSALTFGVDKKEILSNVSGLVRPGEMACILGPSGAGKSTLLNILAGRMSTRRKGMSFSGEISVGGTVVDPVEIRSNIAYVMQDDALPGMSTPREILQMSAVLRGVGTSEAAAESVKELLGGLRLDSCADTRVGTALVKGLSGGERKRTAVAVELITKPNMIFLDEPLSGLDSYAAWTVIQVLKDLATHGCTVLCTIHQPSSEIFQMFDKLIMLAKGKTVYCDSIKSLGTYMDQVGRSVPNSYNPADHILFEVQRQSPAELVQFTQSWDSVATSSTLPEIAALRADPTALGAMALVKKGFFLQLGFLVRREFREVTRNKVGLVMRFAVSGVMGLLFACIFQGIGGKDDKAGGMQGHFGAVCNLMIGAMFGSAQPLLLQFPSERPVFLRESASGMYGVVPYFIAKTIVEIPITFLSSLEQWLISYWVMDLQGNVLLLVVTAWGLSMASASTALFIGCSVATAQSAQELAPLMLVPQILFTGIFVPISLIPEALRWLQYVCALKYAINLACIFEFADSPLGKQFLLERQGIHTDRVWFYAGIMLAIFVGFRSLAMFALWRKSKFVY